jgi:glycine/betaine/sarcosine/D-proline reductase family selenoprotein B
MTPVALTVGSNRIVAGQKIVNPLGDADVDPPRERELRRCIVEKALRVLHTYVREQTVVS